MSLDSLDVTDWASLCTLTEGSPIASRLLFLGRGMLNRLCISPEQMCCR